MLDKRSPVASSTEREERRGGEHLYDAHETEEEEYHPDDFVTLEDIS